MNKTRFVISIDDSDYAASLEMRKIYEAMPDPVAAELGQIRVIYESGDDYLYPAECFVEDRLSDEVLAAVVEAA